MQETPCIASFSIILVCIVGFIFAIVWIYRIISRHKPSTKFKRSRLLKQLDRHAPQLSFLKARRSSPRRSGQGFFGLHYAQSTALLIGTVLLFGIIAENVVSGDGLTIIDVQIAEWLHVNSNAILTKCLLLVTHLHDPIAISVMVALIAFYLIWKKRWCEVLTILLVVPGGMLLNLLVKQLFQRARPSFDHPLVSLSTYSFPSGHVAASTLFYGVLAALLISRTPARSQAGLIIFTAFVMIVVVAFSRMYLGAHYLSDVLAGFLEAIAWLALCLNFTRSRNICHDSKIKSP